MIGVHVRTPKLLWPMFEGMFDPVPYAGDGLAVASWDGLKGGQGSYCSRECCGKNIGRSNKLSDKKEDIDARFWSNVNKTEGCWNWKAGKQNGYGCYWINGKGILAHRFAYETLIGPIPKGLVLDHLCRNQACVNPAHLEPVTDRTNILRGIGLAAKNAKKTHCKRGHLLDGDNLRLTPEGQRICRTCKRARY